MKEKIPMWPWGNKTFTFEENLELYRLFVEKHKSSKDVSEKRLAHWQTDNRKWYRKGKLSEERISLLENIPSWKWSS
jgi:hypothetical protein